MTAVVQVHTEPGPAAHQPRPLPPIVSVGPLLIQISKNKGSVVLSGASGRRHFQNILFLEPAEAGRGPVLPSSLLHSAPPPTGPSFLLHHPEKEYQPELAQI